eukprot:2890988-Amphidinium_carterae.1
MAINKGLVVSSPRRLTAVTKAGLAPARVLLMVPRGVPVWLPCVLHATECMGNPSSLGGTVGEHHL